MKQKKEILTRRHKGHDGNASTNEDGATVFEFDIFACTAIAFVDILLFSAASKNQILSPLAR